MDSCSSTLFGDRCRLKHHNSEGFESWRNATELFTCLSENRRQPLRLPSFPASSQRNVHAHGLWVNSFPGNKARGMTSTGGGDQRDWLMVALLKLFFPAGKSRVKAFEPSCWEPGGWHALGSEDWSTEAQQDEDPRRSKMEAERPFSVTEEGFHLKPLLQVWNYFHLVEIWFILPCWFKGYLSLLE